MTPRSETASPLKILALCLLCLTTAGCAHITECGEKFGRFAKKRADKAAYTIIDRKLTEELLEQGIEEGAPFTIEQIADEATSHVLSTAGRVDPSRDVFTTHTSHLISLSDALYIAFANNRQYLADKENLFSQALGLTESRRNFNVIFANDITGGASLTRSETGHGTAAGSDREWFGSHDWRTSIKKTFFTGATISVGIAHDFTRFFTGASRPAGSSSMSFNIIQPLLNGAGKLVARESLTQAERNMIYNVRDFNRVEKEFAIQIITSYFRLLQSLDTVRNQKLDYESSLYSANRSASFAEAGRVSELDADEARQNVLGARNRWNERQVSYQDELDSFKVFLGLPISLNIAPDPKELEELAERGLVEPDMDLTRALEIALENRLDLKTTHDQLDDTWRGARIALRDFLPTLDLGYSYTTSESRTKDRPFPRFRNNNQTWSLDIGLPTDWTPRRNNYREALIDHERQRRVLEEKRDNVVLEVKQRWRQLEFQRKSHEIAKMSVEIAERRQDAAEMLQEVGRATQRQITDAQEDLLLSRDGLTAALVNYTIQRLEFWHSIERLKIDSKGMWYE